MTDMQQILAGMNELNERAQNTEARATEAERQAQGTQQELTRSQAGAKRKGRCAEVPLTTRAKDWRVSIEVPASAVRRRGRQVEVWTFFLVVHWQKSTNTMKKHRNDSATILDLALTSLKFDAGLLRIIFTELYHVLIMLTRGQAQRLVLKAAEPDEPVSIATTVSKLVDLLANTFSGDFMDSLTGFERRVTSWEHEAKKKTLSDLINIGVVIKGLEKGGFSTSFVHQDCRYDRMDEICERYRKR